MTENRSTSYGWQYQTIGPISLSSQKYVEGYSDSPMVGVPGTLTLEFKATASGIATIDLRLAQTWINAFDP